MLPFLIPAAVGAVQAGISAVPTASDLARNAELRRLKALKESGDLGLTGEERTAYEAAYMNPVKAQQGESLMRRESQMAAAGQTGGGQVLRSQQAEEQNLARSAQTAGAAIQAADVQAKKDQLLKMDQLVADKAQKQRSLLDMAASNIGSVGAAAGQQYAYDKYTKMASPIIMKKLQEAGVSEQDSKDMMTMLKDPAGQELASRFFAMLMAPKPGAPAQPGQPSPTTTPAPPPAPAGTATQNATGTATSQGATGAQAGAPAAGEPPDPSAGLQAYMDWYAKAHPDWKMTPTGT